MNEIITIFGIISSRLFFVFSSILGYHYLGIENSRIFLIYSMIVMILSLVLSLGHLLYKKKVLNKKEITIFFAILFLFCLYLLSSKDTMSTKYFLCFAMWSFPSICLAMYVKEKNLIFNLIRWFEILVPIITFALFIEILIPFIKGESFYESTNINYQQASYLAAFSYGLNIYFMFWGNQYIEFKWCKTKIYRVICIALMFIQLLVIFVSGGRGGMVLAVVYTIVLMIFILRYFREKRLVKFLILASVVISIIMLVFPLLMQNEIFSNGFIRATAFIGNKGINWNGTSGRDVVYADALGKITQKPVLGYGIFNVFGILNGYPHNLFLELMLDGGIVFLFLGVCFLIYIFLKMYKLILLDMRFLILIILILYSIIMLMFSGTYIEESLLWFSMSYIFLESNKNKRIK